MCNIMMKISSHFLNGHFKNDRNHINNAKPVNFDETKI